MDDLSGQKDAKFLAHLDVDREQLLSDESAWRLAGSPPRSDKIGLGLAGATIGLLHDLGKYSTAFQRDWRRLSCTAVGAVAIQEGIR